jgi:hypothetical protein
MWPGAVAVLTLLCCVCTQVYGRAVRIAASLGGFVARVAQDYALGQLDARMADRWAPAAQHS